MQSDRWRRVRDLFVRAMDLEASRRDEFVRSACKDESEVYQEVSELLRCEEPARVIVPPDVEMLADCFHHSNADCLEGTKLGPYVVDCLLGTGGTSYVYLATRREEGLNQQVAIKILKFGMDTDDVLRRFRLESSVLSSLNHANIARVIDAGVTSTGRPFFVLEYVQGQLLTEYCDDHRLDLTGRLNLFLQLCAGVQHAHQQGVIHRDLKPDNVLVARDGGRDTVKIIDFGLAKLMHPSTDGRGSHTVEGRPMGTPAYMSPEQLNPGGRRVDTRTDVYASSIILYQLITGGAPYVVRSSGGPGLFEMQRLVAGAPPRRPSAFLRSRRTQLDRIASRRGAAPAALLKRVSGDLDAIVMKGMALSPDDRYATISEMAEDIRRYLRLEPVLAIPPSRLYRLNKFIRRNKKSTAALFAGTASLILGVSLALYGLSQARKESEHARNAEQAARTELTRSLEVSGFLRNLLLSADPFQLRGKPEEVNLQDLAGLAAHQLQTSRFEDPRTEAEIRVLLSKILANLGRFAEAEEQVVHACSVLRGDSGANALPLADAVQRLGKLRFDQARLPEAEEAVREAIELRHRNGGEESDEMVAALILHGAVLVDMNRLDEAMAVLQRARELLLNLDDHPGEPMATILDQMAVVSDVRGDLNAAEEQIREALTLRIASTGENHPLVAHLRRRLSLILQKKGRLDEAGREIEQALAVIEEQLGSDHPHVGICLRDAGRLMATKGRHRDAVDRYRRALKVNEQAYGVDHPRSVVLLNNLAASLRRLGHLDEAEHHSRNALRIFENDGARNPMALGNLKYTLGRILVDQRRFAEAEPTLQESLAIRQQALGEGHPAVAESFLGISELHLARGDVVSATEFAERAHATLRTRYGSDHGSEAPVLLQRGRILAAMNDMPGAESQWLAALERVQGSGSEVELDCLRTLIRHFEDVGDAAAAPHKKRLLEMDETYTFP